MSTRAPEHLSPAEKIAVIESYAGGYMTLFETGLWDGRGSGMQLLDLFSTYVMLDVDASNCKRARQAMIDAGRNSAQAPIFWGDSGIEMPEALRQFGYGPALFWLDAHLVSEADEPNHSPLLAELDAILAWEHAVLSTVLVDDVRMMGREGWPTVEETIARGADMWDVGFADDILRFTPCA